MKKIISAVLMFFTVILFSSSLSAQELDAVKTEIQTLNDKMAAGMLQNDYSYINKMYMDDAVSLPSYNPIIKGKQGIIAATEESKNASKVIGFKVTTLDVFGEGEFYVEIGNFEMSMEIIGMKEPAKDNGKYITVWQKTDDGLKIKAEMWNTDKNPWAAQE
ncbi:MAG: nuclear transport factor 2 family protein [Ignavibacteriaceae bacterium]|nr:nuclear transport factor 2 family protein [Ignavibacteriaceae bacterium]